MFHKFLLLTFFLNLSPISPSLFPSDSLLKPIPSLEFFRELKNGASDHLVMLFFYRKDCAPCNAIKSQIIDVAESFEGIVESYHVNCNKISKMQKGLPNNQQALLCEEQYKDQLPQVIFLEPPEQKINPYTKKPMKATERPYQGEGSSQAIKDFIKKYLPAFRKVIKTIGDLEEYLEFSDLPNKVILFTDKKETSVMFKGMSSIFRDRIDFGEVHSSSKQIIDKYNIENYPTLMILELQDSGEYKQTEYSGKISFEEVQEFLEQYALEEKISRDNNNKKKEQKNQEKEKEKKKEDIKQQQQQQQQQQTPELLIRKYEKNVLEQDKMILLHIYKPGESNPKSFNEIKDRFGDMFIYYTFELDSPKKQEFAEEKLFIKKSPILKLYPLGTTKKERSKIFFDELITPDEFKQEISDIVEDQSRGFKTMKDFQLYLASTFQEEKIPIIMMHNSKEASISWRVFTHLSEYTDKINFFTVSNPSQEVKDAFTVKKLPAMVGLFSMPPDPNADTQQQQQPNLRVAQFAGKFKFNEMALFFNQILGTDPSSQHQPQQHQTAKQVHHVTNQEDLDKYCTRRSSLCFIAFLDQSEGKDSMKFQGELQILEDMAEKFSQRKIEFLWVDGICHSYLLQRVNLQEDYLPQLLYYNPNKNQYANQIGTFDDSTLRLFIENVLKGRMQFTKIQEEIDIDERNCEDYHIQRKQKLEQQNKENSELDDEILREIMEEERMKQEELEKERKEERKKNKKNKKKSKSKKKEDL